MIEEGKERSSWRDVGGEGDFTWTYDHVVMTDEGEVTKRNLPLDAHRWLGRGHQPRHIALESVCYLR